MAKQTFTTGQVLTAAQMTSLQQTAMGGGSTTAKTASYVLVAADAGTTVAMNAAGSTTITVNTGLFSAGDTVFIQNWGAGTCTITAGTATVSTHGSLALSQYEGGQLYFTSSSAAIFFDISQSTGMTNPMTTTGDTIYSSSGSTPARLGIGTAGQVLTVNSGATAPEWTTPASGSMTLLSTTTLSGAATTVSSINQTYKDLLVTVSNAAWNTSDDAIAFYTNLTSVTSFVRLTNTAVQATNLNTNIGDFSDGVENYKRTGGNNFTSLLIQDYAATTRYKTFYAYSIYEGSTNNGRRACLFGGFASNTAINSVSFRISSGYTLTGGSMRIYGVN